MSYFLARRWRCSYNILLLRLSHRLHLIFFMSADDGHVTLVIILMRIHETTSEISLSLSLACLLAHSVDSSWWPAHRVSIHPHTPAALDSALTPRLENKTYVKSGFPKLVQCRDTKSGCCNFPGTVVPPPCLGQDGHILSIIGCDVNISTEASLLVTAARGWSCMT